MRRTLVPTTLAVVLGLAGCEGMTRQEQMLVGGLAGATAGLITANALRASSDWTIIAALAGATAGTLVAHDNARDRCAYARGDGRYAVRPCR